jgi:hypothetical protein
LAEIPSFVSIKRHDTFLFFFFFLVLGLELKPYTLNHSASPFFVMDFFEVGAQELFAWAGFELDPPDLCFLSS